MEARQRLDHKYECCCCGSHSGWALFICYSQLVFKAFALLMVWALRSLVKSAIVFLFPPKVGDTVQSHSGTAFAVISGLIALSMLLEIGVIWGQRARKAWPNIIFAIVHIPLAVGLGVWSLFLTVMTGVGGFPFMIACGWLCFGSYWVIRAANRTSEYNALVRHTRYGDTIKNDNGDALYRYPVDGPHRV